MGPGAIRLEALELLQHCLDGEGASWERNVSVGILRLLRFTAAADTFQIVPHHLYKSIARSLSREVSHVPLRLKIILPAQRGLPKIFHG